MAVRRLWLLSLIGSTCFLGRRGLHSVLGASLLAPLRASASIQQMATESRKLSEALKSKKPLVVDFAADWCPDCQRMAPLLQELKEQIKDVEFVTLDVSYAAPGSVRAAPS